MLAGPPRLVSLITILLILCLGWWYLRLVEKPTAPGLKTDPRPPPKAFSGNALDFSIPLKFAEGTPKPLGSNYTIALVVPKTEKEDLAWMQREIPEIQLVVYEVDKPNAVNKVPKNKGREAMVYLTYIIDHYDDLPDTVLFMHAHRHAWHNNMIMGLDSVQIIKRLNHDRVARLGYMNVRCHHEPGCPDWIHMDRPGGDFDFFKKPEEIYWRRNIWEEIHPGAPIPASISGICCAQFAVSRERIQQVPLARFQHYRRWLIETTMDDQFSGRIFEYIWHYIFTGHEVYCPAMNTCYCDGYGICFGGRDNFTKYFNKMDERNKLFEELDSYEKKKEQAKEEGKTYQPSEKDIARMAELQIQVEKMDREMEVTRNEAFERGKDPKQRLEETESWDSSHIWDYAPKGD
ncbi:uncharacterized protein BDR25DRAFT_275425 [Lindgomyces ingoldianus]|uniref:Uncharacterized protein n=1 Tax=Lindgomyces ingoldianus TaxID=673940 RepID=A0ACB6RFS6_9PLEO|nr:uncharacterized protein BDR25DRAFT_275425 [Lindgomyces ingoldianus]KAF2477900.1 hypothetical protein BDR25DRAFT_275425 [Lindgomyces ingoldianus]